MAGLSFLSKKSWHTSNISNQEKVWLAEQKAAAEAQKTKELQEQIKAEREREEFDKLAKKKSIGDRGTNWMYEGHGVAGMGGDEGGVSEAATQAAAAVEDAKNEAYLLGKEYVPEGQSKNSGDFAMASEMTGALEKASTYGATIGTGANNSGTMGEGQAATLRIQDDATAAAALKSADDEKNSEWNQDFHLRHEDPMFAVSQRRKAQMKDVEKKKRLLERAGLEVHQVVKGGGDGGGMNRGELHGAEKDEKRRHKKKKRKHHHSKSKKSRKHHRSSSRRHRHRDRSASYSSYSDASSVSSRGGRGRRDRHHSDRRDRDGADYDRHESSRHHRRRHSRSRSVDSRDNYSRYDGGYDDRARKHNHHGRRDDHGRRHRSSRSRSYSPRRDEGHRGGGSHRNRRRSRSYSRSRSRSRDDKYSRKRSRDDYDSDRKRDDTKRQHDEERERRGRSENGREDRKPAAASSIPNDNSKGNADDTNNMKKKPEGYGLIGTSLSNRNSSSTQQPKQSNGYLGPNQKLLDAKRDEAERERRSRLEEGRGRQRHGGDERYGGRNGGGGGSSREERERALEEMERSARDRHRFGR